MPTKYAVNASNTEIKEGDPYIHVTFRIGKDEETGQYVSHCVELDLGSCGGTFEKALANIKDCIEVHLNALDQVGELKRFLRECNVRPRPYKKSKRPVSVKRDIYPDMFTSTEKLSIYCG